jgi:class 3 adenylate cyclase
VSSALTRRFRLRRAIERGDPRLGMIVGVLIAAISALVFVRRDLVTPAERLEHLALDVGFRGRSPIRESDKIVLVDMDDKSIAKFRWPMDRATYAQAILALDRLGARQIVFDVEFKMTTPRPDEFDDATGAYRLTPSDRLLRTAIGKSGKVTLAYHAVRENPIPPELQPHLPKLREVLSRNPGAEEEAVRSAGVPAEAFRGILESAREHVVTTLVAEMLDRRPETSFAEVRGAFLPGYVAHRHQREAAMLQTAYWHWKCVRVLESRMVLARAEPAAPSRLARWSGVTPPMYPFLEHAQGVGCADSEPDADGVQRRAWPYVAVRDRYHPYLGLQMALRDLETPDEKVEAVLRPDAVQIRRVGRSDGALRSTVSLPLDSEGKTLVNWAGNRRRKRGGEEASFLHLPFLRAVEYYQARYETLDGNVRRTIAKLDADVRKEVDADRYLQLSDRLQEVLRGSLEIPFEEARSIEDRMEKIRSRMVQEFTGYLEANERDLKAMPNPSPRVRESFEKARAEWKAQLAGITAPDDAERALKPLVEGKICLIGSAYTASGDLHATPLAAATPGMDVHANLANMALTGQVVRVVPAWVNFAILFATGLLVAFTVTHGQTMASAGATAAVIAGSGALFWALFTGPAILVPGAGPLVTAVLTFAGVTAYKELLTQRSKRKLQRELEKNTSAELVKILLEHPEFLSEPRKMTGTFFFSDVKSFTSISEKMHADVLFPFINRYLDRMTQSLKAHQAFVDKYIGDGIMALFGIPVSTPDHAKLACQAALDCQAGLKPLNAEFKLEGLPEVKVRIGIHSGEVSAGNVGALDRSNYTVLGDNVNLSARLEGANKEYDTSIMISEATWALVTGKFVVRELDRIRVVGKRNAVRIYELLAPAGQPLPVDQGFLDGYEGALALFRLRRWGEAIEGFQKALGIRPGDKPCQIYIERSKVFQLMPPPADWEGVFDLTSK